MKAGRTRWRHWLGAALLAACGPLLASGLQVSPVSLTLSAARQADGLWLSNIGNTPLHAQARVYRWTQHDGKEELVASHELVVSPPMLSVAANSQQLVRVIRTGAPPTDGMEAGYRVIVDELPVDTRTESGLQFVLRYSIPVFVEPVGAAPVPPKLDWSLSTQGGQAVLTVHNGGGTHAQVADLAFADAAGHRTQIAKGLFGYVLPGATMSWTLKTAPATFTAGGSFEALINGEKATQNLSLADRPR
jgi:fimbrial chaperone protein